MTLGEIITKFKSIFDIIIPLLITLGLIYFLWGVAQYVIKQDDEEGQKGARQMMFYGIIALFVIVSVWGLVAILNTTLNIEQGGAPERPHVPGF